MSKENEQGRNKNKRYATPTSELEKQMRETDNPVTRSSIRQIIENRRIREEKEEKEEKGS